MKIAIGTQNEAKRKAVEDVIGLVWKDSEFFYTQTNSGVKDQPTTNDEAIKGAINRAKDALKILNECEYGIGLEGNVAKNEYGMFLLGWVAVVDRQGKTGIGSSAAVLLPKSPEKEVLAGHELGPIVQKLFNDDKNRIRHSSGTNGILTNGLYTRVDEFKDALKCALSIFLNPKLYD